MAFNQIVVGHAMSQLTNCNFECLVLTMKECEGWSREPITVFFYMVFLPLI